MTDITKLTCRSLWRALFVTLLLLVCASGATAADVKISAMPSASALDGTEAVPIVQGAANKKATTAQIKTYAQTGLASVATSGSASDLSAGTLPAARLPALTGDVTSSAGSAATTIAPNAVTLSKIATQANNTILGNISGSTAAPSALTGTQATTVLDTFTTSLKGLAPASGGGTTNFLRADGTWAAPPGGSGGPSAVINDATAARTAALGDANSFIRFTGNVAVTFTIPPNSSVAFPVNTVIEVSQAGAGAVTFAAGAGVAINSRGAAVSTAGQYSVAFVKQVATNVWVLAGDIQ